MEEQKEESAPYDEEKYRIFFYTFFRDNTVAMQEHLKELKETTSTTTTHTNETQGKEDETTTDSTPASPRVPTPRTPTGAAIKGLEVALGQLKELYHL